MKKLILALIAATVTSEACLAQLSTDPEARQNVIMWEKKSRNEVPNPRRDSPAARALVIKANSLLKGQPTCAAMLKASRLLERADGMYIKAKIFDGDTRTVSRRVFWLEDLANAGICRKGRAL
jgi:hypothetical protein